MLRKFIFVATCLVLVFSADAQVKRKIKKGRRNKSQSDFALNKGDIEVDWELGYETVTPLIHSFVWPNTAIRYGLTDRLEVNAEFSPISAWDRSVSPSTNFTGVEPVSFGFNYQVSTESKDRPSLVLSAQLAIPYFATTHFTADRYAPMAEIIANLPLHKHHVIGLSSGVFWDGFSPDPSFIYNANYTCHLTDKWDLGAAVFGFMNGGPSQHNIDLNAAYNFTPDIQLGATGGIGLTPTSHRSYFAINGQWGMNLLAKRKRINRGNSGF